MKPPVGAGAGLVAGVGTGADAVGFADGVVCCQFGFQACVHDGGAASGVVTCGLVTWEGVTWELVAAGVVGGVIAAIAPDMDGVAAAFCIVGVAVDLAGGVVWPAT